jgi:hypothetical protein
MFLRNVCWNSTDYTASYPRRWYSSHPGTCHMSTCGHSPKIRLVHSHLFVACAEMWQQHKRNWPNCCVKLTTRTNHVHCKSLAMTDSAALKSCLQQGICNREFWSCWIWGSHSGEYEELTSCDPVIPLFFGGTYCFRLQGCRVCETSSQLEAISKKRLLFKQNMEAVFSFETSVKLY